MTSILNYTLFAMTFAEYLDGFSPAAIVCFVIGIGLVIVEMLTPGLGAPGVCGVLALLAGVVLQADSFLEGMITLFIIIVLLFISGIIIFKSFNSGKLSKSKIMLNDVIDGTSKTLSEEDAQKLIGFHGIALNDLRPSGYADFDGKRLDVVTRGEFVKKGEKVEIMDIDGVKIMVKKV